jgi:hypothetical protein
VLVRRMRRITGWSPLHFLRGQVIPARVVASIVAVSRCG